jgi:hypothetical protein
MLIKISRLLLLVIIVIVCAHYIPDLYWTKFEKSTHIPFVAYSPVLNDFILSVYTGSELARDARFKDSKGNLYDREGYDTLLPFLNYRQLAALNKMPDTLNGIPVPLDSVRLNNFNINISAADIDYEELHLYPLLESASGRVKLEMPADVFRITNRMEFIDCKTNTVDEKKSELFTAKLKEKNFSFPAKLIAGNPTTRKAFDEGYFVLDSKGKLFHIKMVKGGPFCENTNIPEGTKIVHIAVAENIRKEFYSYVITEDNKVFLQLYDNYRLQELPVKGYNHKTDRLLIMGDYFFRTITLRRDNNIESFVTDRNYKLINHYKESWEGKDESSAGVAAAYIFPFTINFEDNDSAFTSLFFKFSDTRALLFILLSVFGALALVKYRKESISNSVIDLVLVLFTGIYGLIAIAAIKNVE